MKVCYRKIGVGSSVKRRLLGWFRDGASGESGSRRASRMAHMASATDHPAGKKDHDIAEFSIALVSGVALAITALFLCVAPLTGEIAGARDFVVYWATGQQLIHHANPYDADQMMRVERGAGLPGQ